jgi:S-(hydroxymethyl)glutathione dehydrogenase/alcohol dehydrogenase
MRAALLREFDAELVIEDVTVAAPDPREVLVRVAASGVCHTDRTMQLGAQPLPLPQILGHEVAGIVERVGSDVSYVRPGDRVVLCASAFCGHCEWCMRGQLQHCDNKNRTRPGGRPPRLIDAAGHEAYGFVGIGGFAEEVLVHESALVTIPAEMPFEQASLLGCAVITGVGAVVNAAKVTPGQSVVVIGCGGVGLNAVQGARLAGAGRIIAVDRQPAKLTLARTFGATDVVDASTVDSVEAVRELTSGGVDHVLEIVGRPATIEQGFAMLRTMGTLTVVGVARPEDRVSIAPVDLLLEKRIQGTKMGSARLRLDIPMLCGYYLDGRLELDALISQTTMLEGVNAAMTALDEALEARTVVTFDV